MRRHVAGLAAASIIAAGCALPQRHVELVGVDSTMQVVSVPAELRNAYVVAPGSGTRFCSEPVPDIALTSTTQLSGQISALSATGQKIDATAAANLATSVVALAGRNATVLLARDLLFQTCMMRLSGAIRDDASAIALFNRVADLVEHLGKAAQADSETNLARERALLERTGAILDGAKP